ncbi:MaoC family dehydratase [Mesobacterium pallidum]|uniref:MaoC family dehydratase n=1 Tax=Mesobacterium pallidum TaxID=2872037 RepID=UPI001EE37712|nr:MaoC family dehydratase [Mesobacterium pallidum]
MKPEPGTDLPPYRIEHVDPETMKAWAPLLRDPNPIHLDRAAVRAAGLGDRRINQGPINLAYVVTLLHRAFPGAFIEDIRNRFTDNAYEGEALEARATVTGVEDTDGRTRVTLEFTLNSDERAVVISGTAALILPEGEAT